MKKFSSFYKVFFTIAFPIMIQYFITSTLNLMDSVMIGTLGEEAVAALGICNQYFFLFNLIVMGIYSGCNVLISQFWGKQDIVNIKKVLGISLVLGIITSMVFLIIGRVYSTEIISIFNRNDTVMSLGKSYLELVCISYIFMTVSFAYGIGSRGVQRAFVPMLCSAFALVLNIFFNYVFIFGHFHMPAMGVRGAALATLIARIFEMLLILTLIYRRKNILSASCREMLAFDKSFFKNTMTAIMPVIVNELCWGVGFLIYSVIYGNMGTKPMAAVQICNTIQSIFLILIFAVSNAACVMIGNEVGRDNLENVHDYSAKLIKIALLISLAMSVSLILSSKFILSFYTVSSEVYSNAWYMLIITALILPGRFLNVLLIVGILRGGGDASYVLKIELATMWLIGVPLCAWGALLLKLDVYQVFLLVTLEEIIKCIISVKRFKSNKWIKNMTCGINVRCNSTCVNKTTA